MWRIGIPDKEFIRGKVPMTKREVRIITIANACIAPEAIVYDIGAGTGSITIEAAIQASAGHVYAIERNHDGVYLIKKNAEKFDCKNIDVVEAKAPEGMDELPRCDAAIIGGSGNHLESILDSLRVKLKESGRIVVNCVTVQTISRVLKWLHANEGFEYEAVQLQANRLQRVGPYDMSKAENPIYIVTIWKNA